jgi:surface antigen
MKLSQILASACAFLAVMTGAGLSQAANICNETVQANRMVDGIPAYAQCADTTNSSIYSNNGIDTSTTSGGTGWVRTQMSGGYQCTELAHRYLYFKWNVSGVPSGNAGFWCDGTIPTGLVKAASPLHGDLIVFAPGSCGADPTTGHVAVVDVVNSDSTVTFVEQNSSGRRKCQISTAACFLHAVANNGSTLDGGVPSDAATDLASGGSDGAPVAADAVRRSDGSGPGDRSPSSSGGSGGLGGAVATGGTTGAGGTAGGPATQPSSGSGGTPSTPAATPSDSSGACSCRLTHAGRGNAVSVCAIAFALLAAMLDRRRRSAKRTTLQ